MELTFLIHSFILSLTDLVYACLCMPVKWSGRQHAVWWYCLASIVSVNAYAQIKSAYCKCLHVWVCVRKGAATLCLRTQLLYRGARAVWVRMGSGRKWRQMNREELNTLAVSFILLILQAPLFILLLFFTSPPFLPLPEKILQSHTERVPSR